MKRFSAKCSLVLIMLVVFLFATHAVYAADINNAGFKKDVSPTLKERFGVCQEFLDVKWTDKSSYVGLLKADDYKNGQSVPKYLIVKLEKPGTKAFAVRGNGIFYDMDEKLYKGLDIEKFLPGAKIAFSHERVFMNVTKGKRSERFPQEPLPFESFVSHMSDFPNRSFSSFSRTVCVVYPDEKRAFVVEVKKPFMDANMDEKTKKEYETVTKYAEEQCGKIKADSKSDCDTSSLKDSYALDVNGDGKDDYLILLAGKNAKAKAVRYLLLSGKEGYVVTDASGCLGAGRFFYGLADGKTFHLGSCHR
jgi:hypothetical protein